MKKNVNIGTQKISFKQMKYSSYVIKVLMLCSVIIFASCDDKAVDQMGTISLSGDLDFGRVEVGSSRERTLTIYNTGTQDFTVSSIDFHSNAYATDWTGGTISAGDSVEVTITFTPTSSGFYNGRATINHNTAKENSTFSISGKGGPILWTQATANAGWTARDEHTSVVFDNKIWVIGGADEFYLNDVWSSSDGINWTQATANARWTARVGHISVVFDNKIWVIGGLDVRRSYLNDVWSSSDGINWTQETANAGWAGRWGHTSVVFDNKIWVIGGPNGFGLNDVNDVWSSSDGINWIQKTANVGWTVRWGHTSVVFDNKIWVIGESRGSGSASGLNDVWSSSDGINWKQETASAGWSERNEHTSVVFDNKIWVIGGSSFRLNHLNDDVWSSSDGRNWTEKTANAGWTGRSHHISVVFDNKIWVIGGYDGSRLNDVWYAN